jgi:hypothetical protein
VKIQLKQLKSLCIIRHLTFKVRCPAQKKMFAIPGKKTPMSPYRKNGKAKSSAIANSAYKVLWVGIFAGAKES